MMNTSKENLIELMGKIVSRIRKKADYELKASGLTFTQLGTLYALSQQAGMCPSQRELAEILDTDTTTIMVVCDSLEKKGYLKRIPDVSDRRINRLELTETGLGALEEALPKILKMFSPITSSFTDDECRESLQVLEKIYHAVQKL